MSTPSRRWRIAAIGALAVVLGGLLATSSRAGASGNGGRSYRQINLVSDIYGVAANLDPNLVNAWGLVHGPTTPWWVADNGTGLSTLYDSSGQAFPSGTPLVVTVAPPPGGSSAAPTGLVFNGTTDFVVTSGSNSAAARFIFATEDGTISGWAPSVDLQNSILTVDDSASGAVYKGLATGTVNGANFLYTTDFHNGSVDVYDAGFNEASGFAFSDPTIPAGFAPFGIANIGGRILVTYAKQDADRHDDVAGPGNGYVDVYSTSGVLQQRLVSQGALNSP